MLRVAVVGAGLIGKVHIKTIFDNTECQLAAIVDPSESAQLHAKTLNAPWFATLAELLEKRISDGVILASPNMFHVQQAMQCMAAGIPALIEKPVADTVASAETLLHEAGSANETLLVGHHRMHSPIMAKSREIVDSGALGQLVAVSGSALFFKPSHYFDDGPWRTKVGGGPILINMVHEVGNLRYLCGEISSVQAITSNKRRGYEVEDSAAIIFSFANGTIGTFVLSDTAASARSWEQTALENKSYVAYPDEDCYHIAGTNGSLSVPTMHLKQYKNKNERSWWKPFELSDVEIERQDPLALQLQHFCQVIRGEAKPLVTVYDGLQNLRVVDAIIEAAACQKAVHLT